MKIDDLAPRAQQLSPEHSRALLERVLAEGGTAPSRRRLAPRILLAAAAAVGVAAATVSLLPDDAPPEVDCLLGVTFQGERYLEAGIVDQARGEGRRLGDATLVGCGDVPRPSDAPAPAARSVQVWSLADQPTEQVVAIRGTADHFTVLVAEDLTAAQRARVLDAVGATR